MEHNRFFPPHDGIALGALAEKIGAELVDREWANRPIRSVAPISRAGEGDICYILSRRSKAELQSCAASAILCDKALQSAIPSHIPVLLTSAPNTAFARAGALLHPQAMLPQPIVVSSGISPAAFVDPSAHIEDGVTIEPMAVIGADAAIGAGSHIGPGTIIGPHVKIGRNCVIAGGASIICAYLGNDVIIHNGARIGQDGFGYAPGPGGMLKIVQVGRVIIQDKVEIGANTTIDRGAMDDTVIGEGTKIDNLVQVGHNVAIGRHCVIVSQVGISGSATLGDFVVLGGQVGVNGHVTIGHGAQVAATASVKDDLAAGGRYGGAPARPIKEWYREELAIRRLAQRASARHKEDEGKEVS